MTDTPLLIKNAGPADIATIRDLAMRIWPQTYVPIIGEKQVAYMLNLFYTPEVLAQQMQDGHQFIACFDDDQSVGFAAWSEIEPGIFKLHKIYILPDQQGKGIGRFMLDHIVKELRANGASALRLNVNRYNYPAIAFYERNGFKHFADEDIEIGNGYFMNDHVLSLAIS